MISIKTKEEIELMKHAGKIAYELLMSMKNLMKPGVSTKELDEYAYKYIIERDCTPGFLGYEGFPGSICVSINEVVVHGIPSDKIKIKNGDIVTIDLGVCYKGMHTDTAYTYIIGNTTREKRELVEHTREALYKGLDVIKEGIKLNEVCKNIESVALKHHYAVFRELTGHGVGYDLHEDPYIPNYSNLESEDIILKSGMTLAIEPMFGLKTKNIWMLEDGWTIETEDKSPSAHFEHTILVTKDGYEIITGE